MPRAASELPPELLAITAESLDPWGSPYDVMLHVVASGTHVTVTSSGPDRQFDTEDDLSASAVVRDHVGGRGSSPRPDADR